MRTPLRLCLAASVITLTAVAGASAIDSFAAKPAAAVESAAKPVVTVFKDPSCGCCKKWVAHLEASGYKVMAVDTGDMAAVKRALGVDAKLASCHTAVVGGYVIEGHVPAADIDRLLKDKPKIAGLTVPGMITGTPGMEMPGAKAEQYSVLAFQKNGTTSVYAKH